MAKAIVWKSEDEFYDEGDLYLNYQGMFNEDANYILKEKFGLEDCCEGYALKIQNGSAMFLVIKAGYVSLCRGGGGTRGANCKTLMHPELMPAIKETMRKAIRVFFLVSFDNFNPKEVNVRVKSGRKREVMEKQMLEGGNFDFQYLKNMSSHFGLLVYVPKTKMFTYHDGNNIVGEDEPYPIRSKRMRTYLVKMIKEKLRSRPRRRRKFSKENVDPQMSEPTVKEETERDIKRFETIFTDYYTMVVSGCGLLPLYIIQQSVTWNGISRSFRSEKHSLEYGRQIKNWTKEGVQSGKIIYPWTKKAPSN